MASFVETATLKVLDQSSAPTKKINAELAKLFRTAKSLKTLGKGVEIKVGMKQVQSATKALNTLSQSASRIKKNLDITGNIKLGSTAAAVEDLQRLENQAKQTDSAIRRIGNGGGGNSGRGGGRGNTPQPNSDGRGRGGGPNPPRLPPSVPLNFSGFQAFWAGAMMRLGSRIEDAVISGIKKGYTQQDVADTKLNLLGLPKETKAAISVAAQDISNKNSSVTVGTATGFMAENIALTGGDVNAAKTLSMMQAELVRLSIALGETADVATESAFRYSKAADTAGLLTDASGAFDPKAAAEFFNVVKQAKAQFGQEITPSLVATTMKSSRAAKFSLAPNSTGLLTLLSMAEESGSTVGVGINQVLKQLRGVGVKKDVLAEQASWGLVRTKEIATGRLRGPEGDKVEITRTVADGSVDPNMLLADPRGFVEKYIIPGMVKRGLDPNNPNDALTTAQNLTGDRTAVETLTNLILKNQDIKRNVERAQALDVTPGNLTKTMDQSGVVVANDVVIQLTSLMGQVANSFETIFIPALKAASDAMGTFAQWIAGPDGKGSAGRSAATVAGVGVLGYAGLKAGQGLLGMLNPLTGSATALSTSAAQLSAAAAALQSAAGVQAGKATVPGSPPGIKGPGVLGTLGAVGGTLAVASIADDVITGGKGKERISENITIGKYMLELIGMIMQKANKTTGADFGGYEKKTWKDVLLGDAAKPGFKLKDALAINSSGSTYGENGNNPQTMQSEIANGTQQMQTTLSNGASEFSTKAAESGTSFGANASGGILSSAATWGATAGAALRNAIGNIGVNVNTTAQAPQDTGQNLNMAR